MFKFLKITEFRTRKSMVLILSLVHDYHYDLEKQGGCGVMAHERHESNLSQ